MNIKPNVLLLLAVGFFLSSCSSMKNSTSEDREKRADKILKRLDKDDDGFVSRSEVKFPMNEDIFNENDTNKDNKLSRAEIIAYLEAKNKS